jgi:hypothetical protein
MGTLIWRTVYGKEADSNTTPEMSLTRLNTGINQSICPWASLWSAEEIIRRLHVQGSQDRCHDSDHSFTPFIHPGTITYSLCVRQATASG